MLTAHIHVWSTFLRDTTDEALLRRYRALLTHEEQQQEPRFRFLRDRIRYVVTRALVRTTLSRYASISPAEWVFTKNAHGKPAIANDDAEARALHFNVTHTAGLVSVGACHSRELGIDAESLAARQPSVELADRYFTPDEAAALRALPEQERHARFLETWTLKESYIKARGMGLSMPLDRFGFRFTDAGKVELSTSPELHDDAGRWLFWQFQLGTEHVLAVCAERTTLQPQLVMRAVVPFVSEQELNLAPSRTSF